MSTDQPDGRLRADADHYRDTAALNTPPPPVTSDPVVAGMSPVEQLLGVLGFAANADDPRDELDSVEGHAERDQAAMTAAEQFSAQDDAAAKQLAGLSQQVPHMISGAVGAVGGAVAGVLLPLGQVPVQLAQGVQQALQSPLTAAGSADLIDPGEPVDPADTADGEELGGFDVFDGFGGAEGPHGAGSGSQFTGPAAVLGPPPIPGTAPAGGPPAAAVSARTPTAAPGAVTGMPGMPIVPPISAGGGPEKDVKPDAKRVSVPQVRNGAPVQGRVTMTPPVSGVGRILDGKPVAAKRVNPPNADGTTG